MLLLFRSLFLIELICEVKVLIFRCCQPVEGGSRQWDFVPVRMLLSDRCTYVKEIEEGVSVKKELCYEGVICEIAAVTA